MALRPTPPVLPETSIQSPGLIGSELTWLSENSRICWPVLAPLLTTSRYGTWLAEVCLDEVTPESPPARHQLKLWLKAVSTRQLTPTGAASWASSISSRVASRP